MIIQILLIYLPVILADSGYYLYPKNFSTTINFNNILLTNKNEILLYHSDGISNGIIDKYSTPYFNLVNSIKFPLDPKFLNKDAILEIIPLNNNNVFIFGYSVYFYGLVIDANMNIVSTKYLSNWHCFVKMAIGFDSILIPCVECAPTMDCNLVYTEENNNWVIYNYPYKYYEIDLRFLFINNGLLYGCDYDSNNNYLFYSGSFDMTQKNFYSSADCNDLASATSFGGYYQSVYNNKIYFMNTFGEHSDYKSTPNYVFDLTANTINAYTFVPDGYIYIQTFGDNFIACKITDYGTEATLTIFKIDDSSIVQDNLHSYWDCRAETGALSIYKKTIFYPKNFVQNFLVLLNNPYQWPIEGYFGEYLFEPFQSLIIGPNTDLSPSCNNNGWLNNNICQCITSYIGETCNDCAYPYYGPQCILAPYCDYIGGVVNYGKNGNGLCNCYPDFCATSCGVCNPGHYGLYCQSCPNCKNGGECVDGRTSTGVCRCPDPWSGDDCSQCKIGNYGSDCLKTCPNCQISGNTCVNGICDDTGCCACNQQTGACLCQEGWTGEYCDQPINGETQESQQVVIIIISCLVASLLIVSLFFWRIRKLRINNIPISVENLFSYRKVDVLSYQSA